jgi:UDP-N-acetylmuramate: L-alanyl-gamma-D-glutamyl-meso-diaminopimelate ligase
MKISELKPGSTVYLMGICGTAMASLAGLLKSMGYQVTGVDQNAYPPMSVQLEDLGISYFKSYSSENLKKVKPDFVIVGNVISKSNPEVLTLFEMAIPYTSLPNAMGELFLKNKESLVVAGTHGKTTTTSALAWVLDCLGLKPGFLIGGIPKNFSSSFRLSDGSFFAIEGDEYDTAFFDKVPKFTHYHPKQAILTSIEFDHADIYHSLEDVKLAFSKLIASLPSSGHLIYYGDDLNIQSVLSQFSGVSKISYGFGPKNDVQVELLNAKDGMGVFHFALHFKKTSESYPFETQLFGAHNALNFAAVVTLCHIVLNQPLKLIAQSLVSFTGVKRRQEVLGEPRGITVIEDFAHHPTAVAETLRAISTRYRERKIYAVFEPRSATSRRKVFQNDYVQAFERADFILVKESFDQSKIQESDRFSSQKLVSDLKAQAKWARYFSDTDEIVECLDKQAKPGDVIVIMSNGGFDGIYQKLLDRLKFPSSEKRDSTNNFKLEYD